MFNDEVVMRTKVNAFSPTAYLLFFVQGQF